MLAKQIVIALPGISLVGIGACFQPISTSMVAGTAMVSKVSMVAAPGMADVGCTVTFLEQLG